MTTATSPVLESLSTHSSALLHEPVVEIEPESPSEVEFEHSSDGDTASQRSISLSSPPRSPRESAHLDDIELGVPEHSDSLVTPVALVRQGLSNRDSHPYTLDTDFSSEHDGDDRSSFMRRLDDGESPVSSLAPSLHEKDKDNAIGNEEVVDLTEEEVKIRTRDSIRASVASFVSTTSYPPPPIQTPDPRKSIASFASGSSYSKKVRPESMLVTHKGPLVLGIALVDFNHLVGPTIEFSRGDIFDDEEIAKILPFLALPDGAHLIMFFGHPVEKLCTYQYSLVTLVPGLLQNLDDCGSPPLCSRAQGLSKPTELRTSDSKSMMAYIGLPLDLFGKDAFFQPYLPLQQLDMLKETRSWLCGSTNSIVTQQKEVDLLINLETGIFEFRDPKLERSAGLTPADRKWMDDIVKDVNEGWDDSDPSKAASGIQFKGSDDYLRQKFDEYIQGALSCVKYSNFLAKGQNSGVVIADGSGNPDAVQDFNMLWISEFKKTNAYEVWERVTDSMLFDIVEPRERPSVVADIGLRLSEGIQELKLDQQLAPTREAISRTLTAGSTNFFKAVEGVRGRWMQRTASSSPNLSGTEPGTSASSSLVDVSKSDAASLRSGRNSVSLVGSPESSPQPPASVPSGMRPLSLVGSNSPPQPPASDVKSSSWGAGIGSFFSQRATRFSAARQSTLGTPPREASPAPSAGSVRSRVESLAIPTDLGVDELQPRNLDDLYVAGTVPSKAPEVEVGTGLRRLSTSTSGRTSDDLSDTAGTGVAL
ncbi:hypothetical protein PHLCEN_2v13260 [Hermanssonia centrifuga]|uniref:AVL9/DENND6 domain-containing protein n=1 Tax=Hermanssonia centrifuga TaxID=98765 RepID=A0A2R6NEW3_9APHY|nr:hypothetical protein PHLCEN_2v13260 [Hermanssonia centrifuga]